MQANLTIKYNGSTVHIAGLEMKTADNEYTMNACAALTRHGSRMLTAKTADLETAEQALKAAKSKARAMGKKVCKSCEAAALAEAPAGQTFRFLVSLDEANEVTTTVEITAGTRAEAKALARKTPGALAVTSLD